MITPLNTFSVTDLRHKTNKVLKAAENTGVVYLVRRSKTEAAVVNLDYLAALQEAYEDYLDTLEFDQTKSLKRTPLGEHKKRYAKTQKS